jgi:hypothetical protein
MYTAFTAATDNDLIVAGCDMEVLGVNQPARAAAAGIP